jgi:hypothetical protein
MIKLVPHFQSPVMYLLRPSRWQTVDDRPQSTLCPPDLIDPKIECCQQRCLVNQLIETDHNKKHMRIFLFPQKGS